MLNVHPCAFINKENWTMAIRNCNIFSSRNIGKDVQKCSMDLIHFANQFPCCPLAWGYSHHIFVLLFFFLSSSLYMLGMGLPSTNKWSLIYLSIFLYSILPLKLLLACFLSYVWAGNTKNRVNVFSALESVIYLQVYFKWLDKF